MAAIPVKALLCAGLIGSVSGCGWFRTDLPVRDGPQSEPHVTYVVTDAAKTSHASQPVLEEDSE
ncbi:hypothetical protein OO012_15560 [Rhodobacteraceae bacterium KMM 6894]|nr:hypothetical protein [Rhodobacteraceae bacterium KMM 6894]